MSAVDGGIQHRGTAGTERGRTWLIGISRTALAAVSCACRNPGQMPLACRADRYAFSYRCVGAVLKPEIASPKRPRVVQQASSLRLPTHLLAPRISPQTASCHNSVRLYTIGSSEIRHASCISRPRPRPRPLTLSPKSQGMRNRCSLSCRAGTWGRGKRFGGRRWDSWNRKDSQDKRAALSYRCGASSGSDFRIDCRRGGSS